MLLAQRQPPLVSLLAVVVGVLAWDALRWWMPSILFIAGDAGSTPATLLGAMALGTALAPLVIVMALRRWFVPVGWLMGVAAVTVGRLILLITSGGAPQLLGATISVIGVGLVLAALASLAPRPDRARQAFLVGVMLSSALQLLAGGLDPLAQPGAIWELWTLVVVVVFVTVSRSLGWHRIRPRATGRHDRLGRDSVATPEASTLTHAGNAADHQTVDHADGGPPVRSDIAQRAWPWVMTGPLMALVGILLVPTARIGLATGWSDHVVAAVAALLLALVAGGALGGSLLPARPTRFVAVVLLMVGAIAALRPVTLAAVGGQVLLATGLGLFAGVDRFAKHTRHHEADTSGWAQRRRARAGATTLFTFTVVGFAYYAPYDLSLPYPSRGVLLAAAVSLAITGLLAARAEPINHVERRPSTTLAAVALLLVAFPIAATMLAPKTPPIEDHTSTAETFRIVVYNLHMGYSTQGHPSILEIATLLNDLDADLYVLNEVDRGWMTTGMRDDLAILRRELAVRGRFAPAADDVWGNALLTNLPVEDFRVERLPRGSDAMQRSMLTAIVDLGESGQIAIIGTHLSHVDRQGDTRLPQARAIAAEVARLSDRGFPVIVAGDLNAQPGDPELATFGELVTSAIPDGHPTWPSTDPQVQIDHVLVSPQFHVVGYDHLVSTASDHLGLIVDLELLRMQ